MKQYKQILEAINKGIKFALDDFNDDELVGQLTLTIKDTHYTKEYLDLMNYVVDLGLPSGTLWCKYNLGCDYAKLNLLINFISEYGRLPLDSSYLKLEDWLGDYYAWGEIKPNKPKYNWDTYKFDIKNTYLLSKYNDEDNLTKLQPEDDAAYLNMHLHNFKFHIPTILQFSELLKYTTNKKIINYYGIKGLNGRIFKGKNENELFIPTSGYRHNKNIISGIEYVTHLWAANLNIGNIISAWHLYFGLYSDSDINDINNTKINDIERLFGFPIRPVINL